MSDDDDLRSLALRNLAVRRHFWYMLALWIVISAISVATWAATGGGYFWPMWTMIGLGIVTAFAAMRAFLKNGSGPTESQIQSEMKRISG